MILRVKDIPFEGLDVEKSLSPEEIKLVEADFKCISPIMTNAHLEKADEEIIAQVKVTGKYQFECGRCLDPVIQERVDEFTLYIDITPKTEVIDFGEDIRQELVMDLSTVALCTEQCKGLCPDCGVNLNKDKCLCTKEQKAGKANIKLDKGIKI